MKVGFSAAKDLPSPFSGLKVTPETQQRASSLGDAKQRFARTGDIFLQAANQV